jgi:two-component system, sensor histidine kinase
MKNWWQRLSVSKKLYGVVGVMGLLIAAELGTLYFAMSTLSSVRAFVGGEGLWSKAQKNAVHSLQLYVMSRDEEFYRQFLDRISVPLGDQRARLAMMKAVPNRDEISDGLLQGKNDPKDIPGMVDLMLRWHQVPQLARAIQKWEEGDALMSKLIVLGQRLHHEEWKGDRSRARDVDRIVAEISKIDQALTEAETEFSSRLGEASRWLENVLMWLLVLAVCTVEATGIILTVSFGRGLTSVLKELNEAAIRFGRGDFSQAVPVRTKDELGQIAESLNKMIANLLRQKSGRENAEHASETKNLFLANMSHEIRTPLNAILGFSELLSAPDLSLEDRARYAKIIKRTGASLTAIINDILDISKVEAEQIEIVAAPFSLGQLMGDLYTLLRMRCDEKGIELIFEKRAGIPDWIQSDASRLRQILANIIGNSIKFTEVGSVKVVLEARDSDLVFSVTDTGGGIAPDKVDRLFKPFSQGDDSVQKKFGGTGLGLMISRRLAQLLGGDVSLVDNTPGVGSTFVVRIRYAHAEPLPLTEPKSLTTQAADGRDLAGRSILVVEDSKDNQLLADLFLTEAGAAVAFADNGQAGVAAATHGNFDLILMDIQMPVMDGYSATTELRRRGCNTPIIALTGYAMKEDQAKCLKVGCDAYLSKPFDRKKLIESVTTQISKSL